MANPEVLLKRAHLAKRKAASRIAELKAINKELLKALEALLTNHVKLVDSGDCGFWNVEEEEEVIKARAAIAKVEGS